MRHSLYQCFLLFYQFLFDVGLPRTYTMDIWKVVSRIYKAQASKMITIEVLFDVEFPNSAWEKYIISHLVSNSDETGDFLHFFQWGNLLILFWGHEVCACLRMDLSIIQKILSTFIAM